jgi:hypothetical protein
LPNSLSSLILVDLTVNLYVKTENSMLALIDKTSFKLQEKKAQELIENINYDNRFTKYSNFKFRILSFLNFDKESGKKLPSNSA